MKSYLSLYNIDFLYKSGKKVYLNNEIIYESKNKINGLFFELSEIRKKISLDYDLVYFRYLSYYNQNKLSEFLLSFNGSKKVLEIPTYPFKNEKKGIKNYLLRKYLSYYEKEYSKIFDLVTYYGDETSKIFNINSLKLENGINCNRIPFIKNQKKKEKRKFIGVGNLAEWHGYDRIIKSLKVRNKNDVEFHIVGNSEPEFSNLKKLVKELNLEDIVFLHGFKKEKELDLIFENVDLGIDSLARHRSKNNSNSSLKSKEYLARGILILKSHYDSGLDSTNFVYNVTADEELIDIDSILVWLNNTKITNEEIRRYAKDYFSWEKQILKILEKVHLISIGE